MKPKLKPAIAWEAQIELPSGVVAPDSFSGLPGTVPPDNFVVARDRAGNPVSRYGELKWDLTGYHARQKPTNLYFTPFGEGRLSRRQQRIVNTLRKITFNLMYKRRKQMAVGSLKRVFFSLSQMAVWSHANGHELEECFTDAFVMRELMHSHDSADLKVNLSVILSALIEIGEEDLGFLPLGGKTLADLRSYKQQWKDRYKQHAPLPPRIYTAFIGNCLQELAEIDAVLDALFEVLHETNKWLHGHPSQYTNPLDGRRNRGTGETAIIRQLLEHHDLVQFFEARALLLERRGIIRCISGIQLVCRYTLHIFSGARKEEIDYLPYDCIETRKEYGRVDYLLHGATTKLNDGLLKPTYWVTSEQGAYAVRIAKRLADVIYRQVGLCPGKERRTDKYPLFVSLTHLPISNTHRPIEGGPLKMMVGKTSRAQETLHARLLPCIEREDFEDLKRIDPHRAWSSERKYKVGNRWPIATHQLRRSLALYASSSGLVGLPSLRRQLQHITESMSRYYARGSQLAKNIIGEEQDHFGVDYQEEQSESQAMAYLAVALFSDESLFGAQGKQIERQKKSKDGLKILKDRDNTIKLVKKGQLAMTDTMLGGCTEVGPCDKRALRSITGCINCAKAILMPRKVHLVVAAQKARIKALDRNTVEYRMEKHELKMLETALKQMEENLNG